MLYSIVLMILLMEISAAASSNDSQGDVSKRIRTMLVNQNFLYGAATGAGLVLIIVILLYAIYRCVKRRTKKKTCKVRTGHTVDLENGMTELEVHWENETTELGLNLEIGMTELLTPEDPKDSPEEETTQALCPNNTESYPDETEDGYLTPVEVLVVTQPASHSKCQPRADRNRKDSPVYASPITREYSPPSNSSVIKGSAAATEEDNDDDENEDSTPFDKGCGSVPRHNSAQKGYQSLKRIYENCTRAGGYMNVRLLKSEKTQQRGAKVETPSTSETLPSSAGYVNVPSKKRPKLPRPKKAKSGSRRSRVLYL